MDLKLKGKTADSIRDEFCRPHKWANEATILAAAEVLGANVMFLNVRARRLHCGMHGRKTLRATSAAMAASSASARPKSRSKAGSKALGPVTLDPHAAPDRFTIVVWWCNRNRHFEACVRLLAADAVTRRVTVQGVLQPACNAEDARAVAALMRIYQESCKARGIALKV